MQNNVTVFVCCLVLSRQWTVGFSSLTRGAALCEQQQSTQTVKHSIKTKTLSWKLLLNDTLSPSSLSLSLLITFFSFPLFSLSHSFSLISPSLWWPVNLVAGRVHRDVRVTCRSASTRAERGQIQTRAAALVLTAHSLPVCVCFVELHVLTVQLSSIEMTVNTLRNVWLNSSSIIWNSSYSCLSFCCPSWESNYTHLLRC